MCEKDELKKNFEIRSSQKIGVVIDKVREATERTGCSRVIKHKSVVIVKHKSF